MSRRFLFGVALLATISFGSSCFADVRVEYGIVDLTPKPKKADECSVSADVTYEKHGSRTVQCLNIASSCTKPYTFQIFRMAVNGAALGNALSYPMQPGEKKQYCAIDQEKMVYGGFCLIQEQITGKCHLSKTAP